jgi:hypothetical protein
MRGTVLHFSRFGAVIRLDDGRLGMLPSDSSHIAFVRRAWSGGRRPQFSFVVEEGQGRHARLALAEEPGRDGDRELPRARSASTLEQKIIDYLRQTAERDPRASTSEVSRGDERPRSDRLLPFEFRARKQYRDSPERPRRPKR